MSFKAMYRRCEAVLAVSHRPPQGCRAYRTKEEAWAGAQAFAGTRARVLTITGGIRGYTVVYQSNIAEQSRDIRVHTRYSKEYFFIYYG